jgi:hypothetical protein
MSHYSKGLSDIYDLYFNEKYGMWDFARRNKNGPTQTEELRKAFYDFGKRLLIGLEKPVPVSSLARMQVNKNQRMTF